MRQVGERLKFINERSRPFFVRQVANRNPKSYSSSMDLRNIIICLIVFCAGRIAAVEPQEFDLVTCYELALERSEEVGIAAAQWKAAEARYQQATDSWFPGIDLNAGQLYRNEPDQTDSGRSGSNDDETDVRIRASQPIYRGFRLTKLAEARQADMRAAEFDELRVKELLFLDVADAYYQLLSLQRDRTILRDLEKALTDTVTTFEERMKLGKSRRADLLKAQTDLAQTAADISAVDGQLEAARHLMSFLIGRDADLIVAREESSLPEMSDYSLYQTSIINRLDIKAGEARVEAAIRDVEAAQGDRQPTVDAQASYILFERPDDDRIWEVGVALNFPFFDDGTRVARVREQRAFAEINELSLARLRREADLEVNNRITIWQTAQRQVALLQEAATFAEDNYKAQDEDYQMGRSSQLDVLTALAQWQTLRRRASTADAVARVAYAALKVAAGVPVP